MSSDHTTLQQYEARVTAASSCESAAALTPLNLSCIGAQRQGEPRRHTTLTVAAHATQPPPEASGTKGVYRGAQGEVQLRRKLSGGVVRIGGAGQAPRHGRQSCMPAHPHAAVGGTALALLSNVHTTRLAAHA